MKIPKPRKWQKVEVYSVPGLQPHAGAFMSIAGEYVRIMKVLKIKHPTTFYVQRANKLTLAPEFTKIIKSH